MQIILENLSNLERQLQVTVPAIDVANKVKVKLREIAAKAQIPGFRPGKVPLDIINKNYANTARAEVLEKILQETYGEALQQKNLNPAGLPNIKFISSKPEEPFVYTATFEVYPEIKLGDIKQIEVIRDQAQVAESDIDEMLESMRKNHATWQEINDPVRKSKAGDQITIDFTVKPLTNETTETKTEKDVKFVMGDGSMWADFEQPLYGLGVGEEKQFILQMPATHVDKTLANNRAEFVVKLQKLCEPIYPALDDEFAAKMRIPGMAQLREEVSAHLKHELENLLKEIFKHEILDKLLAFNPGEVPKCLVEKELAHKKDNWQQRFAKNKQALEKIPEFPQEQFEEQTKRHIALGLLLSTIIKEQQIKVGYQEIRKKIEDLAAAYYDDSQEMINRLLADQRRIAEMEALLLEEKVVDYLATQMIVKDQNISYKEAIAKNNKSKI